MMRDGRLRTVTLAGFCLLSYLFLLGCALGSGLWAATLHERYKTLGRRQGALRTTIEILSARRRALAATLDDLEALLPRLASDEADLYPEVYGVLQEEGLDVLSIQWAPRAGDRRGLVMRLHGGYNALVRALAGWRDIPTATRVSALTLKDAEPTGSIEADVTLEFLVESPVESLEKE